MPVDLERLWSVPSAEPVQPRLLDAMTGLDEKLLRMYRQAPTRTLGRRITPDVVAALESHRSPPAIQQMTRMAGIALWEREQERIADSLGV